MLNLLENSNEIYFWGIIQIKERFYDRKIRVHSIGIYVNDEVCLYVPYNLITKVRKLFLLKDIYCLIIDTYFNQNIQIIIKDQRDRIGVDDIMDLIQRLKTQRPCISSSFQLIEKRNQGWNAYQFEQMVHQRALGVFEFEEPPKISSSFAIQILDKIGLKIEENKNFDKVQSYPQIMVVPLHSSYHLNDKVRSFRANRRFPILSIFIKNKEGSVSTLWRSSQPLPGLFYKRN